ncbi:hypothetical protein [Amycolatopsis sp. WAC 04182]|uniref:hypothetical protein n=1 Tax=Amycolatopsis sp. WAC 04182 TaxID=2203198 RepID=UPI0018F2E161|nr:hypothetical protein [Amycolatopsis sp. WAC 04182]
MPLSERLVVYSASDVDAGLLSKRVDSAKVTAQALASVLAEKSFTVKRKNRLTRTFVQIKRLSFRSG